MPKISQSDAKRRLYELCRLSAQNGEKHTITDAVGKRFLVIEPMPTAEDSDFVIIPVTVAKDNFARLCSLVKSGIPFQVHNKSNSSSVHIRRFRNYQDDFTIPIEDWIERVADRQIDERINNIYELYKEGKSEMAIFREEISNLLKKHMRIAIGHHPYKEGEI